MAGSPGMRWRRPLVFQMNEIRYSPKAQSDLLEIREYIRVQLENPIAAEEMVRRIVKQIRILETSPGIGSPLSAKVGFETKYRYLVCRTYLIFYYAQDGTVYIVRLLNGRRAYRQLLFEELSEERE